MFDQLLPGFEEHMLIGDSLPPQRPVPSCEDIKREVAHYFRIPASEMVSERRSRDVARPRQVAMYLAKKLTPKSLPNIGRQFGNRDHTTVIHAVRQVERLIGENAAFAEDVAICEGRLLKKLRVLSLFAGIGGFDLGLERTGGFETVAFCEIDPFCQRVLAKHWPGVPIYGDVRELLAGTLSADGITVDVICGGFPCQDISEAGKRAGIDGERSGLWAEYARLICEIRPGFVIVENVAALLGRGISRVLGDLASLGYDAEWDCVGADALGASQHRQRLWILAYPNNARLQRPVWQGQSSAPRTWRAPAHCEPLRSGGRYWPPGPSAIADIPRMADGPTDRVDRLKALGNAVVPQIPELIGRAILASLEEQKEAA